jgi:hypothetical protein
VTCGASTDSSGNPIQSCTATGVTTAQTYSLVVSYAGYAGPQVSATLTVSP